MYVGVEVSVVSFMVSFLGEDYIVGLKLEDVGWYFFFFWVGLMVGWFMGVVIL